MLIVDGAQSLGVAKSTPLILNRTNSSPLGVRLQSGLENENPMQYVLIIHEVADYAAWKTVFDQAAQIRKDAGEISYRLLREESDANQVVHFSEWSSLADARRFFQSPEVVEIRRNAGVKAPQFTYLHELEHGTL